MSSATSSTDSLAPAASVAPFVRDATTWLSYFACFYLFSIQASLGPAMPYVRSERGLSYTVAGLHFTAVAVGALIMGLLASRVVRKWDGAPRSGQESAASRWEDCSLFPVAPLHSRFSAR